MQTRVSAERLIAAPARVLYHLISDYREHHRPGGFLPPAFTDQVVEQGGIGAGTRVRVTMKLGGRGQTFTATITEPEPGRVLLETSETVRTVFTVEPVDAQHARVRFDTTIDAGGLGGLIARVFLPTTLRSLYADELRWLELHAQSHLPLPVADVRRGSDELQGAFVPWPPFAPVAA
jgi:hypothetical protein